MKHSNSLKWGMSMFVFFTVIGGMMATTRVTWAQQPTWHVATSSSDATGDGSETNPFATIQHRIDVANDGDTLLVHPETCTENINCDGKNIVVASLFHVTHDESYISQTVIDGERNGRIVTFESGEDATATPSGFTITNEYAHWTYPESRGGGIGCWNSDPTLMNLKVSGNEATHEGADLYFGHCSSNLRNTTIASNTGNTGGGGIRCSYGSPSIEDADPLFVGNGDCHLSDNSPYIGAATLDRAPATDIEGSQRPNLEGSNPDKGAYESLLGVPSSPLSTITFTRIITGHIVSDGGNSSGACWGDYDDDGYLDLFVTNWRGEDNFLYHNEGDGTFIKIVSGAIVNDGGWSRSCTWGDYDNDGYLDLFVSNDGGGNFLYHNNSDGTFVRITDGPIARDGGNCYGAAWVDYDNDGWLDLFVARHTNANNLLYHNSGDGTFARVIGGAIVSDGGYSHSVSWGDYDDDGDPDLFVANVNDQNNFLYRNNGNGTFTKIISGAIVTDGGFSSSSNWTDYDNDGDLDLFVANRSLDNFLYQNDGDGTFTRIATGVIVTDGDGHDSSWGDYDNDGDLDLYVGPWDVSENSRLYRNNGDGTFTRIISGTIVSAIGHSGANWGDYDNDGDLDLFLALSTGDNALYRNEGNENHWLNIKSVGTVSNRSAIGTRIKVTATIGGALVGQIQEISGQTGMYSQNSLNAEFGLRDATVIDSIVVEWPSGIVQVLENVAADQFLPITESEGLYHLIAILSFDNDLSTYASTVIERVRQGAITNPDMRATLLVDRAGDGNTEVVEIAGGVVTHTQALPWLPDAHELDTADPDALAGFLQWARSQYPDDRAVVALVGHGVGPAPEVHPPQAGVMGIMSQLPPLPQGREATPMDVTSGTYLSTPELGRALAAATSDGADPFDLLFLDVCFGGNLDVLYEVRDAAHVLVASPNYAWAAFAYDHYLPHFTLTATPESMAQAIVDEYQAALDNAHPNAVFWIHGADLASLGDAVSALGDALRAALPTPGQPSLVLSAVLDSQFADTTLCAGDLTLCPPDELIGLGSFARNLQSQFPAGSAVHTAAGDILVQLANVHGSYRTGQPWFKPDVTWLYTDTVTLLAPLTRTLTAETVWRASVYTSALLTGVQVQGLTQTVSITRPLAYASDGRWVEFIAAWYEPLTPTVGQMCRVMPPVQGDVTTPTVPIVLTAEPGYADIELGWNPTNVPEMVGYRISRAVSGTHAFASIAVVTDTTYFDTDPMLIRGTAYCYRVAALWPGGVAAATSNIACATMGQIALWVPDVWAVPGETAIVPVNIRNADDLQIAATDIWLDFDANVIEPLVISRTALTEGYDWSYCITSTQAYSRVRIAAIASTPPTLYGDGSLFWLTVRVRGTEGMTSPLDLQEFLAGVGGSTIYAPDDPFTPVPLALEDGVFHVSDSYVMGDLNGNSVVEAIDAWLVLQIASGQLTPTREQQHAGDVNGNGVVDAADATMILYYAVHGCWPTPGAGGQVAHLSRAAQDVTLILDDVSGAPGAMVEATLRADNLSNWAGGEMVIAYDMGLVEDIIDVEVAGLASGFPLAFHDDGAGLLRIAVANGSETSGSGALVTIRLRLAATAPVGASAPLALAEAHLNDLFGRDFATSALQRVIGRRNGELTITPEEWHYVYLPLVLRDQ